MRIRIFTASLFFLLCICQCQSQFRPPQVDITDNDTVGYNFIRQEENQIQNSAYLDPLFQKLYLQRTGGGQKISIVHIGDSHILGNFLTREVRERLQRAFGDAGRGMIFPYRLADTNGPRDYLMQSNCRWQGGNCTKDLSAATPFGIAGLSVCMNNSKGELTFKLRDTATSETRFFTKITIFQRKTPSEFDINVRDQTTNQQAQLIVEDEYARSYYFDRPVAEATLSAERGTSQQKKLTLDGIAIENELAGVIYHSIGVNGAKYQDFGRAQYFARQVAELSPDLIILSFGTNEAQGKVDQATIRRNIDNLVTNLLENSPNALILFTTPADSYLRGKGFNPFMPDISNVIRQYAQSKNYALWDLHEFSGGENSATFWKERGLMTSDSVHYTKAGYAVQGKLLYQSIIKGYNEFAQRKP